MITHLFCNSPLLCVYVYKGEADGSVVIFQTYTPLPDMGASRFLVTYSLHLANAGSGGFSFDCPIGQSIGELSPRVPRFCYYERDCFVSTRSRTKSTFLGENQEIFLSVSSSTPDILNPSLQILIAAFSSRFI